MHPGRVVTFGVPDQRKGTEDVAVIAEVDVDDVEDIDIDEPTAPEASAEATDSGRGVPQSAASASDTSKT